MRTFSLIVLAAMAIAGVLLILQSPSKSPHSPSASVGDAEELPRISFTEARSYAGQEVIVSGVIRNVFNNRQAVYLGFQEPRRGSFFVRILQEDWGNFPRPPETIYQPGQLIHVRGKIVWYQGDPVIYVRSPSQIEIITKEDHE